MKRMLALLRRDILSSAKDQLMIWATVAPLVAALAARLFLPTLGQATVNVVVTSEMPAALVEQLRSYADVEVAADRAALDQRVLAYDDAVGIVPGQDGGYTIVLEGNESHDSRVLPEIVLQKLLSGTGPAVSTVEVSGDRVPFRELIGAITAVAALLLGSMVMGFQIIEDRESRVMQALGVSPLSRREYVLARGLLALMLSILLVFGSLWILGLTSFDHLQLLALVVVASSAGVLTGFVIGALSSNQIAGIANVKFGSLLFLLPPALVFLVPEQYQAVLYWLPTYWAFVGFRAILVDGAEWATLMPMLAWTVATGLAFAAVAYPWLRGRLDFARS